MDLSTSKHLVVFQTGAMYTHHGQRIAAWSQTVVSDSWEVACFIDFDRQIAGSFPCKSFDFTDRRDFAAHVKYMYDHGQYDNGHRHSIDLGQDLSRLMVAGYRAFVIANPTTHDLGTVPRAAILA